MGAFFEGGLKEENGGASISKIARAPAGHHRPDNLSPEEKWRTGLVGISYVRRVMAFFSPARLSIKKEKQGNVMHFLSPLCLVVPLDTTDGILINRVRAQFRPS